MRAPRYRFPNEVRSTTRIIASRMARDAAVARTPEQLDAWISENPDVKQSLEKGGYNTAFTSHDLFPLLQVFVAQAAPESQGAERPRAAAQLRPRGGFWWIVGVIVVAGVILAVVL